MKGPVEPWGSFCAIILHCCISNIFCCICRHSPLMRDCSTMNVKHTTKDPLNLLSTSCLPSEDAYKGMKHKCLFSPFSFYVELTSSQWRIMPKDVTHRTKKHFWGMCFLKILPPEFHLIHYSIAKNPTTELARSIAMLRSF